MLAQNIKTIPQKQNDSLSFLAFDEHMVFFMASSLLVPSENDEDTYFLCFICCSGHVADSFHLSYDYVMIFQMQEEEPPPVPTFLKVRLYHHNVIIISTYCSTM